MTMDDIADPSGMDDIPVSGDQLDEAQPAPQLFKMQDLMQAIAGQSDLKRSDLREAAGLICDALGAALDDGHAISLPGLGKITPRKRTVVALVCLISPKNTAMCAWNRPVKMR